MSTLHEIPAVLALDPQNNEHSCVVKSLPKASKIWRHQQKKDRMD